MISIHKTTLCLLVMLAIIDICACSEKKTVKIPLYKRDTRNGSIRDAFKENEIIDETTARRRGLDTVEKDMDNYLDMQYYSTLYIGENDFEMTFLYDTGSSALWFPLSNCSNCPRNNLYEPTSTFSSTGTRDGILYLSGSVDGVYATDQVSLTDGGDNITMTVLAVDATDSIDGMRSDGILGMTPTSTGREDLLVQKLYSAGYITTHVFGVDYGRTTETSTIVFGGYDESVVLSDQDFVYVSLYTDDYWEAKFTYIGYGDTAVNINANIGILDTGTSLTYFESSNGDWTKIYNLIKSGKECGYSNNSGFRACYCDDIDDFEDIVFTFGGFNITMSHENYVYLESTGICRIYVDGINYSFSPASILLGDSFLRNYYVLHDVENLRIGFYVEGSNATPLYVPSTTLAGRDDESTAYITYLNYGLTVAILAILVSL